MEKKAAADGFGCLKSNSNRAGTSNHQVILYLKFAQICYTIPCACRCVGMVDEADSKSVASDGVWVRVPPPAPKRRESERDSLLFGGPPPAGNDPLRSNSWEGIPNPLPSPPHAKLISGSDLDCPGAPKRREPEQDSLLFSGLLLVAHPGRAMIRLAHSIGRE